MLKPTSVSTKQRRIAKLARQAPDMAMDLSHHMDLEWFEEAYRRTRKDGAVGVDGETAQAYAQDLLSGPIEFDQFDPSRRCR
jgi:RNA-directed DNA polymerase